jgi:DNA-binding response OmpR family regulator
MKILVVDDDLVLCDVIGFTLRRAGFEVITAHDGHIAFERWQLEVPDLVILDIKLPGIDGITLCKRIRAQRNTPVIILSVQGTDEDVVNGLDIGADDYIAKPFSPTQLVARIRAVLRRSGLTISPGLLRFEDLVFDVARHEVQHAANAEGIQLTQLESRLLEVLMVSVGQVLPSESLVNYIWGVDGGDKVMLKQLVRRLRQKIEPDPTHPSYIENVPGVGYTLIQRR